MHSLAPKINIRNADTKQTVKVIQIERIKYSVLEISPSSMTSNSNVRWLITEFSRLYKPLMERISISRFKVSIAPELTVWWEVLLHNGAIKFYLTVPDKNDIKNTIKRQVMKTWSRSTVVEVNDFMVEYNTEEVDICKLSLQYNPILSLDIKNPNYSPLDSLLNAKHYLKDDDLALLQIGMTPLNNEWNKSAREIHDAIRKGSRVPRKKGKAITKGEIAQKFLRAIGLIAEELINFVGDFLIPGWQEDRTIKDSNKHIYGELGQNNISSRDKIKSEGFKTSIRILAKSSDYERRMSILRAISSGFDPLEGDNRLKETVIKHKQKSKELRRIRDRKMPSGINDDILCSLELSKIIQVPDRKAQIEHYNELSLVQHRGETEVPKDIFEVDDMGIPFAQYQDTDGQYKTVYFSGKDKNLLCMARVIIGEPGTGKTTFAQNFALDAFNKGYGVFLIDAADGKMVQRVLDRVKPEQRNKVKIIDFLNTDNPIGLGWNEIFRGRNTDVIEDLVVEEIIQYVELVSGTELNMRARQWVENAVKATFVTPDATLQDVENMINNSAYRERTIPTIEDPELRADWEYYHTKMKAEERKNIYDEAFRRLSPVMRKKALKNFILQRPKKDSLGNYLFDVRKWMDEGYMVLIRANETLGETLQTALVSFVISKFNLAMVSREDVTNEDDRNPCFLILDEPDHYIKGSDRWRNMLTRFRKYRCGLTLMFHGWQQLKEADKDLPKIIRKAGPHYVIFQTDEDNLKELKSVIEPDFKISDIVKGMPRHHAVIRLKMYGKDGEVIPAFMAKSLGRTEDLFEYHNNDDLYDECARELGRPKSEVMEEIFRERSSSDFNVVTNEESSDLLIGVHQYEEEDEEEYSVEEILEETVGQFIQQQIDNGEEPDYDLVEHLDELLEGDWNEDE